MKNGDPMISAEEEEGRRNDSSYVQRGISRRIRNSEALIGKKKRKSKWTKPVQVVSLRNALKLLASYNAVTVRIFQRANISTQDKEGGKDEFAYIFPSLY